MGVLEMKLQATNGHIIAGTKIDEHRFVGRVKAAQLFQLAPDPRDAENKKKADASKDLQDIQDVRQDVQRLFEGAKKKNVPAYADYIVDLHSGGDGITPPITLYSETPLDVEEQEDGCCFIQIPWDEKLIAIDGETQLAARHEAANIEPETKKEFVAIYLCHGKDREWARQSFHDLNALGVKPNAALSIGMDARDPITKVCREVERKVPFFAGRVNKVRRQLRSTDADIVTITALRGACVTMAKGINGVQFGARPVPIDEHDLPAVEAAAIDWFTAVAEAIGPAMEDREAKLAGAPAILAAIGAMGNPLVKIADSSVRSAEARRLAKALQSVDWTRSAQWTGIAGKLNPKGVLSVGGAKENAYATFGALADVTSPAYQVIRPSLHKNAA
jgi:DGQHR domain-containing protein